MRPALLPVPLGKPDETNTQDMLRAYLQVQEQLHATQLSIEHSRKESDAAAGETARVFAGRLQAIEQTLAVQRTQELEAMQNSNKVMLIIAGLFAVLGFLAMLFMAYFQWRTVSRLAGISTALPVGRALGSASPPAALGVEDLPVEVRQLHPVAVAHPDAPDPRSGQVEDRRASQAASAGHNAEARHEGKGRRLKPEF